MISSGDVHDLTELTATATQFAELMEAATSLMEALAPAMSRLGGLYAALDRLGGSLQEMPTARSWMPIATTGVAAPQPSGAPARPSPGVTENSHNGSSPLVAHGSTSVALHSTTLVFLHYGGSQPADLEKVYQTLADIPGVAEVIPGAYSRDRAAFDIRTSRPAHELALQEALRSAIPDVISGEWMASGEFLVVIGGAGAQSAHAPTAC
jgi:hypothetical protein